MMFFKEQTLKISFDEVQFTDFFLLYRLFVLFFQNFFPNPRPLRIFSYVFFKKLCSFSAYF